jgi:hypothetical protein
MKVNFSTSPKVVSVLFYFFCVCGVILMQMEKSKSRRELLSLLVILALAGFLLTYERQLETTSINVGRDVWEQCAKRTQSSLNEKMKK